LELGFVAPELLETLVVLLVVAVKFRVGLWFVISLIAQTPAAPTATIIINNNKPAFCFILITFLSHIILFFIYFFYLFSISKIFIDSILLIFSNIKNSLILDKLGFKYNLIYRYRRNKSRIKTLQCVNKLN
jgi:hypothetical protein